jgi:hypothetical protein
MIWQRRDSVVASQLTTSPVKIICSRRRDLAGANATCCRRAPTVSVLTSNDPLLTHLLLATAARPPPGAGWHADVHGP